MVAGNMKVDKWGSRPTYGYQDGAKVADTTPKIKVLRLVFSGLSSSDYKNCRKWHPGFPYRACICRHVAAGSGTDSLIPTDNDDQKGAAELY